MEPNSDTSDIIARLTSRELQVFQMIAHGDTAKGVADKLRIKEWTVGTHLRRIFTKLNVDGQAAMVRRGADLIDPAFQTS
jgi:DNA-binding NarL/FixJ family response regulator